VADDPQYIEALKKFGAEEPTERDIKALETELYKGPDRGATVVLAALVERSLEKLLRTRIRSEGASVLFEYGAPLWSQPNPGKPAIADSSGLGSGLPCLQKMERDGNQGRTYEQP